MGALVFKRQRWKTNYCESICQECFHESRNDRGENSILTDTTTGYSLMKIQIWKQPEKNVFKLILILQPDFLKSLKEYSGFFFSFMKIQEFTNFYFQNLGVPVDLIQPFKTIKLIQNLSWWVGFWDRRVNIVLFNQSIKGLFPKKFSSIVQRILRVLRKNKFEP